MTGLTDPVGVSIVHPWDPWRQGVGGFDTFLDGFLRYAPPDWEIELVGTTAEPHVRRVGRWHELDYAGRKVRFFPTLADPNPNMVPRIPLSLQFSLAARLRRPQPSSRVVVYHRFESAYAVPITSPGRSAVFYLHNHPAEVDSPYSDVRWARLSALFRRLLVQHLNSASLVVCVDPRTPAWIAEALPGWRGQVMWQKQWADPRVFHLEGGGAVSDARAALRRRLGMGSDTRLLVFAGRFEKQKALFQLIDIFARARQQLDRLGLVLVGEGRLRRRMEEAATERGVEQAVRFLPPVSRADLASIYHGCDVAVCTSAFEAGPRYVFEAMACGLPVVSFDVGQVADLIGTDCRVGYLATDRTASEFIKGLACVLSSPQTPERAARCAQRVAAHTPQAVLGPILAAYARLAAPDGAAPFAGGESRQPEQD